MITLTQTNPKQQTISRAIVLLVESQNNGILVAAACHKAAVDILAPYNGFGRVGYAVDLINSGKTRQAIEALRYALTQVV